MHLRSLVPTAAIALAAVTLSRAALGLPTALGAPAPRLRDTADRAAAAGSGHASDGRFHNTLPDEVVTRGALLSVLRAMLTRGPIGRPAAPVPLAADPAPATAGTVPSARRLSTATAAGACDLIDPPSPRPSLEGQPERRSGRTLARAESEAVAARGGQAQ